MYISKEQLDSRLEGQNNLELKKREGVGRHSTIPHETKVLIGVLAKTDTQANVAKEFGTSASNVSRITRDESLIEEIDKVSEKVSDRVTGKAVDVLMKSLGVVENRIGSTKTAIEASQVAKNVAGIVQQFTPRETNPNGFSPKILINIHGSKQKTEEAYETVEVESIAQ